MHLADLVKHLEIVRRGHHPSFDYGLVNRCLGLVPGSRTTKEDIREIAEKYREVDRHLYQACLTICTLAEDNRRLEAENQFMLRLINSKLPQEQI